MTPLATKKRMAAFAKRMEQRLPLSNYEYQYLQYVFEMLSTGKNPAQIFGLAYGRGKSQQDERLRQHLHFVIHWIECAIQPTDSMEGGLGYSVTKACEEGSQILRMLLGVPESEKYDPAYIRQCYYNPKYSHMRKIDVDEFDQDSPYRP